jgi:Ala-tRNA(Pro) deacylase
MGGAGRRHIRHTRQIPMRRRRVVANLGKPRRRIRSCRCYIFADAERRERPGASAVEEVEMCVGDYLLEQRIAFERLPHPPAYSAQKRAKYLRLSGEEVAKAVLLSGPSGYLLAVLPATHQVDTKALAVQLGGAVRLANGRDIAKVFSDCEWGVVPPFGARYGIPTLLDDAIASESRIVLETHSQFEAVRMLCRDFERVEKPRRLSFSRRRSVSH